MKIRMVVITTVVTAGIIGGVGYGVYYAMKSQEKPVDVVPVVNVNQMYYGDGDGTLYGTVTSQVAQNVTLNEEYEIEKIYVKQGDTVKEGDPLFSYDMTLPELELEMEQLTLQTMELDKTRLEKELEKLKKTPATASLSSTDFVMTSSGDGGEALSDGLDGNAEIRIAEDGTEKSSGTADTDVQILDLNGDSQNPDASSDEGKANTENSQTSGDLTLDGIEVVGDPSVDASGSQKENEESEMLKSALLMYYQLLDALGETDPDLIQLSDIAEPVETANKFYCSRLASADEEMIRNYQISDSVRELLGEEECSKADEYIKRMVNYQALYVRLQEKEIHTKLANRGDAPLSAEIYTDIRRAEECHRKWFTDEQSDGTWQMRKTVSQILGEEKSQELEIGYVELLIDELDGTLSDLRIKTEQARAEYERLNSSIQSEVNPDSIEKLESVEELLKNGTQTEPSTETESETQTETSAETESETQTETSAETESETQTESSVETESETAVEPVTESESESEGTVSPEDIQAFIEQFMTLASSMETDENYLENMKSAIGIFQQVLGELSSDAIGEEKNTMNQYHLKQELTENPEYFTEGLEDLYHSVCVRYVSGLISLVEPLELNPQDPEVYMEAYAAYETAKAAYEELGAEWTSEIKEKYILDACDMILMIQAIDDRKPQEEVIAAVMAARDAYVLLSEEAKPYVWNFDRLQELMKKYGIEFETESESETESEFPWDDGGDDWGDWGGGDGYTAEELKEMIEEKEEELKDADLDIREQKLTVRQKQRIVDGKTVKSTLNGTVISVGSEDGSSDGDYFLKVASTEGLYAKGSMNELSLAEIHVGDTISGILQNTGASFTAVVKEISDYPDPNGSYYSYGSENTNASYYRFLALIDDPEGLEEGDAELQLSESLQNYSGGIYLEKYFVRTESDGRTYVMKQGQDGLLTRQYVTTGKTIYGWAIEIVSGITLEDKLAFPYGKDVVEGAKTNEVDQLDYQ